MKLHKILASFALSVSAMTICAADMPTGIEHLYLVGDAAPAGWNLGAAPELSMHDGALSWTGYLDLGQFKFTTSRGSWDSVVSLERDNYGVTVGSEMGIQYNPEGGPNDWKWYNNTPGYYTLTVDLSENTLMVAPVRLFLVGDASPAGWGRGAELTLQDNGDYTWSGTLETGEMKLLCNTYNWDSFVSADKDNHNVMMCVPMAMQHYADGSGSHDWKWNNGLGGEYDITVNLETMTIVVAPQKLCIVGDASPADNKWGRDILMERKARGEYEWKGHLNGGQMKVVISQYSDNWNSIVSAEKNNCDVRLNIPMPYKYCAQGDDDNDWKWNNTMSGEYTVKANLVDRTLTVSMDIDELYLVGEASQAGWAREYAPALKKDAKGNLIWTGYLKDGNFKLLLSRTSDNWESIMPADCDNYGVVMGKPMNFAFNSGNDWKWRIGAGVYTISVDMSSNTLTVNSVNTPLYLIGDATPAGWNRGDAPEMVMDKNGQYVWEGHLNTGTFKFLIDSERWDSFGSGSDTNADVVNNTPMSLMYNLDRDIQWNVTSAGKYRIVVNLANGTMTASRLTELYLVGEATTAGWTRENAPELTSVDGNLYTWSGHLGTGQFKLLKSRDSWDSYVSADSDNFGVQIDVPMGMRDWGDDNKWYNNVAGNYTITADIAAGTLTVSPTRGGIVDPENMGHTMAQFELDNVADNLYRFCGNLTAGKYRIVFSDGSALRINDVARFETTRNHVAGSEFIVADESDRMQVFVHTETKHVIFDVYSRFDALYAIGDFNNWELGEDYKFSPSADDDDTFEWEGEILIDKGASFKIAAVVGDKQYAILPYVGGSEFTEVSHFYTGEPQDLEPQEPSRVKGASPRSGADWTLADSGTYKFAVNMFNREVNVSSTPTQSAVESVSAEPTVTVYAHAGVLTVVAAQTTEVSVFTPAGLCVAKQICNGRCEFQLERGIYLVTAGERVVKVMM